MESILILGMNEEALTFTIGWLKLTELIPQSVAMTTLTFTIGWLKP